MVAVADKALQNPCASCGGGCCSQLLVNVCGQDVWDIALGLQLKPTAFLGFACLGEKTSYDFRLDGSDKSYCMALYMKPRPEGDHRCVFALDMPNHQFRCGIYSVRPIACRAYPVSLDGEEVVVKRGVCCPDGAWNASQLDLAYWQAELGRHDMEFSIYEFVVASWNKEVMDKPPKAEPDFRPFLNFLMQAYSRLEAARQIIPAIEWPEIWKGWRRFTAQGKNPLSLEWKEPLEPTGWDCWLKGIYAAVAEAVQQGKTQL